MKHNVSKSPSFTDPIMKLVRAVASSGSTTARQPRRSPRLPIKVTAQLLQPKQAPVAVMLKNISVGGASMTTHVRLRVNDRVALRVQLGPDLRTEIPARVVHTGARNNDFKCQYGLKFVTMSQRDYERLAAFIHDPKNGWQFDAPPPPWSPDAA